MAGVLPVIEVDGRSTQPPITPNVPRPPPPHTHPGTMAGVLPVIEVDGRRIGSGARGPVVGRLQALYAGLMDQEAARGRNAALDDA